ncbi:protein jagged-1-like [Mytilus californianus]|uniref:protein jagged-1-like n=1 Tax=Mytilus californianus TaxID=6549 RepID=UPI0022466191|nr:protein jagged-1-like [Mytilus californianus]
MLTVQQGGYVNNVVDGGLTDLSDTVVYDECLENVDKSDYDQLSPEKDGFNHDYIILTSTLKAESNQSDNEVHQKNKSLLRPIFLIMCCILISAGATAAATFFATKHFYSENKGKYTDSTQCNVTSDNGYNETIDSPGSCVIEPCENGGTCVNTICLCQDGFAGSKCEIDVNQTCKADADTFIPHPNTCQLFYNCSQALTPLPKEDRIYTYKPQILRPAYLHECPYPELFSVKTLSCQNYTEVECGSRYETKNKCDYLAISYTCDSACKLCIYFTPDCVGFADGIYDNIYISIGGTYFECKDERNIYVGENPCPTSMAPYNGECKDLFEIPINHYGIGYGVDCNGRENGNYKCERIRRCDIYYTCVNGIPTLSHCDSGKTFDSKSSFCQIPTNACSPCGSVVNGC